MSVLLYASETNERREKLREIIESVVAKGTMSHCCSFSTLVQELVRASSSSTITIICCACEEELWEILSLRDLLHDMRIILILPVAEKETVAKGHLLRPRFMTYMDNDLEDVAAVLRKMLKQTE